MQDLDCLLVYESGGKRTSVAFAARDGYGDRALAVVPTASPGDRSLLELTLRAKLPVRLLRAELMKPMPAWADEATRTLVNGYQSWSRSEEYLPRERQRGLNPALWFLRPYGEPAAHYAGGRGRFHSWSLTYLRSAGHVWLLGSTDEHSGFTLFTVDWPRRCVRAAKECGGRFLVAGEEYRLLSLFAGEAPVPGELFAAYARACRLPEPPAKRLTGWLSWYYYYTKVGAAEIRQVLAGLRELALPLDFVMIDDGYETAVGDWLSPNGRFPDGLAAPAAEIRAAGYRPGLWAAPFVAEKRSALWREHADWFLREPGGRPVKAGFNDNWSGTFFALDLEKAAPREYVRGVIREMTAGWGYELLKIDFAYAACLRPTPRRTRGKLMAGAMDLLRGAAGDCPLIGCGIPLGTAWGRTEYCRVGADVAPYWQDSKFVHLHYRERVATENGLTSALHLSWLNGRFFLNDPDVFILRRGTRLLPAQRLTLFLLTYLCGGVFSFSDPPALLGEEERSLLWRAFPAVMPEVTDYTHDGDLHELRLAHEGDRFLALANLGGKPLTWTAPLDFEGILLFDQMAGEIVADGTALPTLALAPYETRLLKLSRPGPTQVLGTTLHLLGGRADVAEVRITKDGPEVSLAPGTPGRGKVLIALGPEDAGRCPGAERRGEFALATAEVK